MTRHAFTWLDNPLWQWTVTLLRGVWYRVFGCKQTTGHVRTPVEQRYWNLCARRANDCACTVRANGLVVVLPLLWSPLDHTWFSQGKVALRHCHNSEWPVVIADASSLTQQIVWEMPNRTWRCIELYSDCLGIHIDPLDPWNAGVMKGKEFRCSGTYRTLCSMRFGVTESVCNVACLPISDLYKIGIWHATWQSTTYKKGGIF